MSHDPVIEKLRSLPEPPLPGEVWQRLDRRRARRTAARRGGLALALAGGFAFLGFMPGSDEKAVPPHPPASAVAQAPRAESLSTIDRALQAAYVRGASDDEVAPLWEVRKRLAHSFTPSPDPS